MDLPSRASVLPEELKGALLLPDQQECEAQGRTPRRSLSWAEARAFGKGNPRICLYVHAFGLPQTLLVLYVLWGCWDNCYGEEDCPKPRSVFNWLFATLGPVLPLAVLGVRLLVLPFSRHEIFMTVIVWFLMAVVRLLIYVYWMGGSGWFSDHIFLMACILGMLHTEIAYAHDYVLDGYVWAVPPLLVSYFLVWRISEEAYVTASFYHSRLQSLLALLVGVPLFVSMAGLWVHWRPMCIKAPREPEAPSDAEAGAGAPRRAEEEDAHENGREAGAEDNGSPFAEDLPPLHVPSSNLATQRREGGAAVAEGPRRAASEYAGGAPKSEVPRRSASEHVGGTDKFVVHRTPSFGSDQAQAAPGPLPHGMLEPPQAFSLAGAASAPPPVDAGGVLATEILAPPSGAAAFGGGTWSPSSACGTNPFQDPAGSPRDTMAPAAAAATESGSARGSADFLAPAPEADPPSHQHEPSIAAAGAAVPPAGPDRRQAEEQERDSTPEWRPPTAKEQPKQPACCAFMPSFRRQPNASGDRSEEEGASGQRRARGRSFDGIKDF